jgi:hypothetical protein
MASKPTSARASASDSSSLSSCSKTTFSALPASARDVALQVPFERQILKPVFHLIGFRLWV